MLLVNSGSRKTVTHERKLQRSKRNVAAQQRAIGHVGINRETEIGTGTQLA